MKAGQKTIRQFPEAREKNSMAAAPAKGSLIYVRTTASMKKAVKMFCVRGNTTAQNWVVELFETALAKRAPDPWCTSMPGERKRSSR